VADFSGVPTPAPAVAGFFSAAGFFSGAVFFPPAAGVAFALALAAGFAPEGGADAAVSARPKTDRITLHKKMMRR
jgi:hypothetical protein